MDFFTYTIAIVGLLLLIVLGTGWLYYGLDLFDLFDEDYLGIFLLRTAAWGMIFFTTVALCISICNYLDSRTSKYLQAKEIEETICGK